MSTVSLIVHRQTGYVEGKYLHSQQNYVEKIYILFYTYHLYLATFCFDENSGLRVLGVRVLIFDDTPYMAAAEQECNLRITVSSLKHI